MVVSSGVQLPFLTSNSPSVAPPFTKTQTQFKLHRSNNSEIVDSPVESESEASSSSFRDESTLPDLVYDDNDTKSNDHKERTLLINIIISYVTKQLVDSFAGSLKSLSCTCGCTDFSLLRLFITEIIKRSKTSLHRFKMSTIYLLRFDQVLQYMSELDIVPGPLCLKKIILCSFMLTSSSMDNQPVNFQIWQLISGLGEARLKSEFKQFIEAFTVNANEYQNLVVTTNEFDDLNLKLKKAIHSCVHVV